MNTTLSRTRRCLSCTGMLLLFSCVLNAQVRVTIEKAGTLSSLLSQEQQDTCAALIVRGRLNSADIKVLRRMAGYEENGKCGRLAALDLRKAKFVKDEEPFMVLDAAECRLAGTAVPDRYRETASASTPHELWNDVPKKVSKYRAQYYLGYSENSPKEVHAMAEDFSHGYEQLMDVFVTTSDFRFAQGITDAQWKDMEEKYGITSFKGHRITRESDRYVLRAYPLKNTFLSDMFYGCKNLREVALSHKMKMDFSVMDELAVYRIVRMKK